jgi:hypothetical protein
MRMNKSMKCLTAALVLAAISLLGGCGNGDGGGGYSEGGSQIPSTVSVKTGTIASDSWGYTGSSPVALSAPAGTSVLVAGRSLLLDGSHAVVSGTSATDIRFSGDVTTLTSAEQAALPATFVSYLSIDIESVKSVSPSLSVSVDAATLPVGQALSIYSYDSASRSWKLVQSTTVDATGKAAFSAAAPGLYGVFR